MMKLVSGGLALAALVGLCSTIGCSSAPDSEETQPAASSEDALGRDPANCVFHHHLRKYNTQCTYQQPPTPAQRDQVNDFLTHASGIGSCVGVVVAGVTLAAGTMTVVLTPVSIAGAAAAVGSAAGCGQYIGNFLRGLLAGWSCTTYEVSVSYQDHYNTCAMACGGSQRLTSSNDCYCGRTPLACQDAPPTPVSTPPACNPSGSDGCFNTTSCPLTGAGRANCSGASYASRGARVLNIEGTKYYSCTASGWRACQ